MASVTLGTSITDTTNGVTSYTTGSFTPTEGDLLVVGLIGTNSVITGDVTTTEGLTFTNVETALCRTSTDIINLYVADALSTGVSQTLTWDLTADPGTGCAIIVMFVSGMTKVGAAAIRQSKKIEDQLISTIPTVTFDSAALTGNPTIGLVGNGSNPAGLTPPTSWTELADVGFATPNTGLEAVHRNSGFTGTTIAWINTSTPWGAIIVELDATLAMPPQSLMMLDCGV